MDSTLTFVARRVAGGWRLRCDALPEVEVTCARLTEAHARVREEISKVAGVELVDVDVVVSPELSGRAVGHLEAASTLQEQLQQLADRAREELALGVQFLLEDGLTQREVALALGLSVARVRQLAAAPTEKPVPLTTRHMQHLYESGALRAPQ